MFSTKSYAPPPFNREALVYGLLEQFPSHKNCHGLLVDLVEEFKCSNCLIDVYDPWVNQDQAMDEYNIKLIEQPLKGKYDAIVLAVAHDIIGEFSLEQIKAFGKNNHVLYYIKYLLGPNEVDGRL